MTWILLIVNVHACSLSLDGFRTRADCLKAAAIVTEAQIPDSFAVCVPDRK